MDGSLPKTSVAEILAHKICALAPPRLPAPVRRKCEDLLIDVIGLCLTARNADYVKAALAGWDEEGSCTAIRHARGMNAAGGAFAVRALPGRGRRGVARHRRRRRGDLPAEPRRAQGGAQGGLPSDRRV